MFVSETSGGVWWNVIDPLLFFERNVHWGQQETSVSCWPQRKLKPALFICNSHLCCQHIVILLRPAHRPMWLAQTDSVQWSNDTSHMLAWAALQLSTTQNTRSMCAPVHSDDVYRCTESVSVPGYLSQRWFLKWWRLEKLFSDLL